MSVGGSKQQYARIPVIGGTSDGRIVRVCWPLSGNMTGLSKCIGPHVVAFEPDTLPFPHAEANGPVPETDPEAVEVYRVVELVHRDRGRAWCLVHAELPKDAALAHWEYVFESFRGMLFGPCTSTTP